MSKKEISNESHFCRSLKPVGRILELEDYFVWGCSPIDGPDGKVHVFYSRWPKAEGMEGWLTHSEVGHAVADDVEGVFEPVDIALTGRGGGHWDSVTIHNPTIHKVGDKYALFYMGNSDGTLETKRVGLAISDSLYGPWERIGDKPLLPTGDAGCWDDYGTTNPSFIVHPNGQFWVYYKAWDRAQYEYDVVHAEVHPEYGIPVLGNRKYGVAMADKIEGPYEKYADNPVLDFSSLGDNKQCEDAYIWIADGKFNMILRDMGFYNHDYGLYYTSDDGLNWSEPKIAFYGADIYFNEESKGLTRQGRFERPQILVRNGKAAYLFAAFRGGKYDTASGVVLKLK